ncbi:MULTISPECIES: flagellar hook capping FlgD N-terminal domain-containing protein [Halocynthiibacter]|uniref:Basal-body rod modification protein FlgD n=1 Tax=Halocynthiibacter halioticoli TaxID=2986804 RepID=A0AAE3LS77_9RHOB|nr:MULTISPECIES: flagellar hook capping FlgD N-terminal domain-containing protein [Halocynthiibacter]MCV6823061.1 flagellar hook assembly protein FlgD [Halocynthiibacter halioticoli]MCW4056062.1 flagellar hook assembly protein FlgD [Halocynthiibacter sp. SDUM655004]
MEISSQTPPTQTSEPIRESTADRKALASDFDTFLTMLTAQINNQDPLNPTDSTDFAAQLATFSNVEQGVKTNELLENLVASYGSNGMSQVASWVGMDARSSAPTKFDGAPITLAPNPPSGADQTFLLVRNELGTVVQRTEIPVTDEPFEWTGQNTAGSPMLHGNYSFSLESYSEGEQLATKQIESYSQVVEARQDGGTTKLVLDSGAIVAVDEVTALRKE